MIRSLNIPPIHPLFFANIALMLGVYGAFLGYKCTTICFLALLLGGALLVYEKSIQYSLWFLIPLFFGLGSIRYYQEQVNLDYFQQTFTSQKCTIKGKINSIEQIENQKFTHKIMLTTSTITTKDNKQYVNYAVFIYTNNITGMLVGDIVTIQDITFNRNNNNSFLRYLAKEGAVASSFTSNLNHTLHHRPYFSFSRFIQKIRLNLFLSLKGKITKETFLLFSSLFLGKQHKQPNTTLSMRDECMEWGISHYLARSGLHLVICIMLWQFILHILPLSLAYKNSLLIVITLLYALLSWNSVSFYRALWLFLISKWGVLSRLPIQGIHSIGLISLCFIFYNPMQLFFVDFQLSFLLTFGLIFYSSIQRVAHTTIQPVASA